MTKMELSLGEGEPVSDLMAVNVGRRTAAVVIGMAAVAARAALVLRTSSKWCSNSSCSDIVPCRGHQ